MNLFYRTIGSGKPLFILHGFLGSSDNWVTLGKKFAEKYHVILVDLRNHGRSPQSEFWDYPVMASDIYQLAETLGFNDIRLIGHSMGGKVGMTTAGEYPGLLNKLVVVDIAPRYYPADHQEIIDGLLAIDLRQINRRQDAEMALTGIVPERSVRQFLLKNLETVPGKGFKWKINLEGINNHLENVGAATIPSDTISTPSLFLRGARSDYISDEDLIEITKYYSDARVESIENAGHWLHAENPRPFMEKVFAFLEP